MSISEKTRERGLSFIIQSQLMGKMVTKSIKLLLVEGGIPGTNTTLSPLQHVFMSQRQLATST